MDVDVQANPGPPLTLADLRPHTLQTGNVLRERLLPAERIIYSLEELFALRSRTCAQDARPHFYQLRRYGLLRYRGPRLNNRGRINTLVRPIPTIVNYRVDCRRYNDSPNAENLRLTQ